VVVVARTSHGDETSGGTAYDDLGCGGAVCGGAVCGGAVCGGAVTLLVAALLAGGAAWFAIPAVPLARLRGGQALRPGVALTGTRRAADVRPGVALRSKVRLGPGARGQPWGRRLVAAVLLVTGPLLMLSLPVPPWMAFAPLLPAAPAALRWTRQRRTRRALEQTRRAAVPELCGALAAELTAGRTPAAALREASAALPALADLLLPAVTAAELGGDVAVELQEMAGRPGADGLRHLAACWRVSERSGAGLAAALGRLGEGLRGEEAVRREVTAQLAAPRASARLLAALPAFGLVLGAGLGARPWEVLLGTPWGMGCLMAGLVLDGCGLLWVEQLSKRAAEPG
jgi:tight adherence protein B